MDTAQPGKNVAVSVVAPVYKAEHIIDELVRRIKDALLTVTEDFEIILVDDRGPDNSWLKVLENTSADKRVKGVRLSRNFGQQIAISAGMQFASGDLTVIMDGDLQNPPEAIPEIVKILQEKDVDIVYTISTVRNNRRDERTSRFFWFFMNRILKLDMVADQLMMKGFSKRFLGIFNSYTERVRVVTGITQDIGMNSYILPIKNEPRKIGKSNYSFFKRMHLMIDIILAMTEKPLNFLITLSIAIMMLCVGMGIYTMVTYFVFHVPAGYTSLALLITFFSSTILLVLGVTGRYLSAIYLEVRQRPLFLVKSKINL